MNASESTTLPSKVCTKCGVEKASTEFQQNAFGKGGLQSQCKECRADAGFAYRAKNREKETARCHDYYIANREKVAAYHRVHRAANQERIIESNRDYRAANKEKRAVYDHTWSAANPEKCAARTARYRAAHPERIAAYNAANPEKNAANTRNYQARKRGNGGTHTAADIQAQYDRQKGRCYYCHVSVADDYHVDHVTPVSTGGWNSPENLVVACTTCNLKKGAKHPMDFCGRLL